MEAALAQSGADPPHVALIDIGLPGMTGIEGIRRIHCRWPEVSLVTLTVYDDDARILEALCAGATGYLLKNTPAGRLQDAIRDSASGGSPMSPEVARRVIELFRRVQPPPQADYQLTPHEMRILNLLVRGENYKTAAVTLGVSVNTISYHVRHIYEKLHVHSRAEAVTKALRGGLIR
jgi:DNA-binding NarL/FixJ family response regulator